MTAAAMRPAARPIPGPADRETFFAAQVRHRQASWKLAALCILAVVLLGVPIAMVVSPLVIGAAILVFDLINLFVPAPDLLGAVGHLADRLHDPAGQLAFYALLALPGIVVVLPAWMAVRRLLFRGGVGGILLSLGAREPAPGDAEEHQLENVIGEMAVAAGVRPPNLRLLDGPGMGAAAVGTGIDDATIVVSRALLDELDRDETQALIGHLVASIGNGDLRIAHLIVSVHATVSLIEALTFVAVSPAVRGQLRGVARAARRTDAAGREESERMSLLLLNGIAADAAEGALAGADGRLRTSGPPRARTSTAGTPTFRDRVVTVLVFPFVLTWMLVQLCRIAFLMLLTDPLTSLLWRRRRFLADATAVQLTRYPTALASAIRRVADVETPLPGGPWTSFLFAAGPRGRIGGGPVAGFGRAKGDMGIDCLPDPYRRIERLRAMGAELPAAGRSQGGAAAIVGAIWSVIFPLLVGAVWIFSFGACVLTTTLGFFMIPMCLIPVVWLPHVLLRVTVPWLLHR